MIINIFMVKSSLLPENMGYVKANKISLKHMFKWNVNQQLLTKDKSKVDISH